MHEDHDWKELVLQELKRLNDGQEDMRNQFNEFRIVMTGETHFRKGRSSVYSAIWAVAVSLFVNMAAFLYKAHH